jgi:hypothetical protein
VSVLLAADPVELYPPGKQDGHGWTEPADGAYWCGLGNLQLTAGASDPRAADGGGHGPHDPARSESGTLFLPPQVCLTEGSAARIRGELYVLSQVRKITDPIDPQGGISCWAASVTGPHRG